MTDTVTCSECGEQFDASVDEDLNKRSPCPSCGSTTRNISVSVSDVIALTTGMDAILVKKPELYFLLKTTRLPAPSKKSRYLMPRIFA